MHLGQRRDVPRRHCTDFFEFLTDYFFLRLRSGRLRIQIRVLGPRLNDKARLERSDYVARAFASLLRLEPGDVVLVSMRGDNRLELAARALLDVLRNVHHARFWHVRWKAG